MEGRFLIISIIIRWREANIASTAPFRSRWNIKLDIGPNLDDKPFPPLMHYLRRRKFGARGTGGYAFLANLAVVPSIFH
jgi:hypothetical protein